MRTYEDSYGWFGYTRFVVSVLDYIHWIDLKTVSVLSMVERLTILSLGKPHRG
jgi:hypothetical protein